MWYLKKTWFDEVPGINEVIIHYTFTPLFQTADWRLPHEVRRMEKNAMVKQGLGGVTLSGEDSVATAQVSERPVSAPPNARVKVIKMPSSVLNQATGKFDENYLFHFFYDVWSNGTVTATPVFTEPIVCQEIELTDWRGNVSGVCAHWSIYDGDAFVYSPTDTADFIARYVEDAPLRSHKFYGHSDREWFSRAKWAVVQQLPLPRRWCTKVWGPKGASLIQGWHIGFVDQPSPPGEFPRGHEEWTGYTVRTL
ncbi:MAG: hypothetical protein JO189_22440 [Deltaproteobacteria bacterium]|nr:hypothetical protein [Deltaproteobacteria bacterium]